MGFVAIFMLALGLAMDATAAAASRGLAAPRVRFRDAALVGLMFGGFQAIMPVIGWFVGARIGPVVQAWDHWIAFVLLGGIGAKTLREAFKGGADDDGPKGEPFGAKIMLVLAIATSIDALAAGVTLPMLGAPILLSVVTIGVVTAACSVIGLFAGRYFGERLGRRLDVFGGLVLIGLALKILLSHLAAE